MSPRDHEAAFVRAFIVRAKRDRYLQFLQNPKKRDRILGALYHCHDIDERFAIELPPSEHTAEMVELRLKQRGAPKTTCVISPDRELDGRTMPLGEALELTIGWGGGTILSCIPGRLAFFEPEDIGLRYILERKEPPG